MKLKYYLRGLGIGIMVTTIILAISFARRDHSMSDEEVIARARELGMVMEENDKKSEGQKLQGTENEDDPDSTEGTDAPDNTDTPDSTDVPEDQNGGATGGTEGGSVTRQEFTVEVGDSSNMVAQKLEQLGLVDNAEAFNQYMMDRGFAGGVLPGTIFIPQGATYEEIAQMLVDKELQR